MKRRGWEVVIAGEHHRVEINDVDRPLVAVVDGTPVAVNWEEREVAPVLIGDAPGRLVRSVDTRSSALHFVIGFLVEALLHGSGSVGGRTYRVDLRVDGAIVTRGPSR